MQWWRRVDSISQRKNKPQPVLNGSFLRGLNEFFAKLCQDDSYTEPSFQEIDREKYLSPRLNEAEVMLALSKSKRQHQDRTLYLTGFGEIMLYF